MEIEILETKLLLCSERVIYIQKQQLLLIADIHLGKITHFRKAGIGLPQAAINKDYRELNDIIEKYNPDKIILMGDLFHSGYNSAWEKFRDFLKVYQQKEFVLVKGNHDILAPNNYDISNFTVVDDYYIDQLIITHEPMQSIPEGKYNLYGHLHPGVRVKGASRQSMRLPCFYFEQDQGVLPAFGMFTGLAIVNPKAGDQVYAIAGEEIVCLT